MKGRGGHFETLGSKECSTALLQPPLQVIVSHLKLG